MHGIGVEALKMRDYSPVGGVGLLLPQAQAILGAFRLSYVAKYLGMWVGPEGEQYAWIQASPSFATSVRGLKFQGAPLYACTLIYNTGCLTKLSYVGQCYPPSEDLLRLEKHVLGSVLCTPYRAVPIPVLYRLKLAGLPCQFNSLQEYLWAVRGASCPFYCP